MKPYLRTLSRCIMVWNNLNIYHTNFPTEVEERKSHALAHTLLNDGVLDDERLSLGRGVGHGDRALQGRLRDRCVGPLAVPAGVGLIVGARAATVYHEDLVLARPPAPTGDAPGEHQEDITTPGSPEPPLAQDPRVSTAVQASDLACANYLCLRGRHGSAWEGKRDLG